LRVVSAEEGSTVLEMPVDERFLNFAGGVQGGILASFADSNMGTAINTVSEDDEIHATLELKINFFRPATPEMSPLRATSKVLHRSRRVGHTTSEIRSASGELVAKATASWAIRKVPGEPPPDRE
jgi:uncharacterized protein (TIGR00369 family)